MFIPEIIDVQALDNYVLRIKFADGVRGDVNLSHLAGRGVFKYWDQNDHFKKVTIMNGRWLAWSDEIDLDADALYLKLSGKRPEDLFPNLKEDPTYA
jgi:hypothetical protein